MIVHLFNMTLQQVCLVAYLALVYASIKWLEVMWTWYAEENDKNALHSWRSCLPQQLAATWFLHYEFPALGMRLANDL